MSSCVVLKKYTSGCEKSPGGIGRAWLFDNTLFDFTQSAPSAGLIQPYTAIADTGSGHFIYPVEFKQNEAEYSVDQSSKDGYSQEYAHTISLALRNLSQQTLQWTYLIDAASVARQLGLIVQLYSGKILVFGEASVNAAPIDIPFFMYQDGSKGGTGKTFSESNVYTAQIKGMYYRMPVEFTGVLSDLTDLEPS